MRWSVNAEWLILATDFFGMWHWMQLSRGDVACLRVEDNEQL